MTGLRRPGHVDVAASARIRELLRKPTRTADVLARLASAVYLRLSGGEVIALLSSDAVRLPIGLVLPTSGREFPLTRLSVPVVVGAGAVHAGSWSCRVSRLISVDAPVGLTPDRQSCGLIGRRLDDDIDAIPDAHLPLSLVLSRDVDADRPTPELVRRLLGAGPGLTPAGDDVLAGLLVAMGSFDVAGRSFRAAVLAAAPTGTTALSAQLLRCAARGESIPQVNRLLRAMSTSGGHERLDDALDDLIRVGHTSGLALAAGVLAAARLASRCAASPAVRAGRRGIRTDPCCA